MAICEIHIWGGEGICPSCDLEDKQFVEFHSKKFSELNLKAPPKNEEMPQGLPFGIIDPDYAKVFTTARILAWQYGFALTTHGSFTRDLDIVLVPWAKNAFNGAVLNIIGMLCDSCDLVWDGTHGEKPFGRKAYTLFFKKFGDPRWVDLSVFPVPDKPPTESDSKNGNT